MEKPVKFKKEVTVYKCPKCNYEGWSDSTTRQHIKTAHEYPELEKEVELFGSTCKFISREQANKFIKEYANHRSKPYDSEYECKIEWKGPGKYHFVENQVGSASDWYDKKDEYVLTFYKLMY